ncbi:MAG: ROK family protein [Candidatus Omnitrophota bacterium]
MKSMKKYIIGVDIGGTKIATGLISKEGKLKKTVVLPTLAEEGFKTSLDQVYLSIENLLRSSRTGKKDIEGIGVCAPGPLDPVNGVVHNPPNLPGWKEVPLAGLIRKSFKIKTKVENDANAAGMAEVIWGSAKGYKQVFYVTVSTGIGTAVIIDGKIYHGKNGMAGEGGHVTINYDADDAKCNCGAVGCVEALASGPRTVRRMIKKLEKDPDIKTSIIDMVDGDMDQISMITVEKAAKDGDVFAQEVIREQGKILGIWLGSVINILDPGIIVIGGGVSLIGKPLFTEIKRSILAHTINIFANKTPVVQAKLKTNVGIFGAASLFICK